MRILLLVALLFALGAPVLARQSSPVFEYDDCPFELPQGEAEGDSIECGYLIVPEDHDDPDSPEIELAVAILYADTDSPEPDPVIYLAGGPGGSAVLEVDAWVEDPIRESRDIILLDQRGTGYSYPSLSCPQPADDATEAEAAQDCHDYWVDQGVNLSAYNSLQSAADVAALREALDYDQWNLFGVSYGTRLALAIMRDNPAGVRSVILDSTYPPQVNDQEEASSGQVATFRVLFDGCAADATCDDAYPDLENVFYETVDQLNSEPAEYVAVDPETDEEYDVTLSGDDFVEALFLAMYSTDNIPYLPAVIYAVADGDYGLLDDLNSGVLLDEYARVGTLRQQDEEPSDDADAMYNSVTCSEEIPFNDYNAAIADAESVPPELRDGMVGAVEATFMICDIWDVTPAPAFEADPVVSDIPTLVLAGEYDPATPPVWGRIAAQTLSSSFFFEFPGVGHGVVDGGDCPRSIIMAFLDDPLTEPDGSCIADMTGPEFVVMD